MKVSSAGLDLIKASEGLRLTAYYDPVKVLTIGYGITNAAGVVKITPGMTITQAQAEEYLALALRKYEQTVRDTIKVKITQNQFDAMVSLCYNIGQTGFAKSSVARYCNALQFDRAADAFRLWVKAGGKTLPGLVKRRDFERALFMLPDKTPPAPEPSPPLVSESPAPVLVPDPVVVAETPKPAPAPSLGLWASIKQWLRS